jgi:hypothetical protein
MASDFVIDPSPTPDDARLAVLLGVTALELCRHVRLSEEARSMLSASMAPLDYVRTLIDGREYFTALRVLAQALPKREAVWWGCQCLWQAARPMPAEPVEAALSAAVRWVLEPTEEHRRAAEPVAVAAGETTAPGCLALAAHWSGGSMTPPDLPPVPPPPYLCGQMVAGSLLLIESEFPDVFTSDTYPQYLALGLAIADGDNLWEKETLASPARPACEPVVA